MSVLLYGGQGEGVEQEGRREEEEVVVVDQWSRRLVGCEVALRVCRRPRRRGWKDTNGKNRKK